MNGFMQELLEPQSILAGILAAALFWRTYWDSKRSGLATSAKTIVGAASDAVTLVEGRFQQLEADITRLEKALDTERTEKAALTAEVERLRAEIEQLTNEEDRRCRELGKENDRLKSEIGRLRKRIRELETQVSRLES